MVQHEKNEWKKQGEKCFGIWNMYTNAFTVDTKFMNNKQLADINLVVKWYVNEARFSNISIED